VDTGVQETSISTELIFDGKIQARPFFSQDLSLTDPVTYKAVYTVTTLNGVVTDPTTLLLTVYPCEEGGRPMGITLNAQANCLGDDIELDLEDIVHSSSSTIDWTTFNIITDAAVAGATTSWDGVTRTLTYSPGVLAGVDKVEWEVADANGIFSGKINIYFDLDCPAVITATDDTACVVCGTTTSIDVLANDVGDFDPLSLQIAQFPQYGAATVINNEIVYTIPANVAGTDVIKYQVKNRNHTGVSNLGTLDIEIVCAGSDNSTLAC